MDETKDETSFTSAPKEEVIPLSTMRRIIAQRMTESFQHVPHHYISMNVDMEQLRALREVIGSSVERATGKRLTYTDLLLKALATAMAEHPEINVSWTPEGIRRLSDVNIGLAVAIADGLVVPVIRQADKKSLTEINKARADVVERATRHKLPPEEMMGGSITMTNMGMYGVSQGSPIINPPESCILSVGCIEDRPTVVDGAVVVRPIMTMTLALDHRVLDGVAGSRFLARVKNLIEHPSVDAI